MPVNAATSFESVTHAGHCWNFDACHGEVAKILVHPQNSVQTSSSPEFADWLCVRMVKDPHHLWIQPAEIPHVEPPPDLWSVKTMDDSPSNQAEVVSGDLVHTERPGFTRTQRTGDPLYKVTSRPASKPWFSRR